MQVFHKVRNDLLWNPGRTEFDADVHGFNVRRHGGSQGFHIGSETRIGFRSGLCPRQLGPHIAGQVFVAYFPFITDGVQENLPLVTQFCLNVFRRAMQELRHAAEIHPAVFPQGNEQSVSGVFRRFRHLRGLEYPLPEDRGLFGRGGPGGSAMLAGRFRRQALVVIGLQRFQQGMLRVIPHQAAIGL